MSVCWSVDLWMEDRLLAQNRPFRTFGVELFVWLVVNFFVNVSGWRLASMSKDNLMQMKGTVGPWCGYARYALD